MSTSAASASLSDDVEAQFEEATDTIRTAQEGDEVLFGNRKQPLTVLDTGGEPGEDRYIVLQGPNGGRYTIREEYTRNDTPKFRTEESSKAANDLRFADPEHGERFRMTEATRGMADGGEAAEIEETPGVESEETTVQEGGDGGDDDDGGSENIEPTEHNWDEFDLSIGSGEMVVSGEHDTLGDHFTAIYQWSDDDVWVYNSDKSTVGPDLGQSSRGALLAMIEDELEASDEADIKRTAPRPDDPLAASDSDERTPRLADDEARRMQGWGLESNGTEYDPDDFATEMTGDFLHDADFGERGGGSGLVDTIRSSLPFGRVDVPAGHTFVDELRAMLGVDVPRQYDDWVLFDHGTVTVPGQDYRRLVWYNQETGENVALVVNEVGDGNTAWAVYHGDKSDGEQEAVWSTFADMDDGVTPREKAKAAMGVVRETMGVNNDPDLELVTDTRNNITVVDDTDKESLGRKVVQAGAGPVVTAGEVAYDLGAGAGGALASWFDENWRKVGKVTAFGILYAGAWLFDHFIPGGQVNPIMREDEIGVHFQARYASDPTAAVVNQLGGDVDDITPDDEEFEGEAVQSLAEFRFTVDPRQLAFSKYTTAKHDPVFNLSRDDLIRFANIAGLDDASFTLPDGSAKDYLEMLSDTRGDIDSDSSTSGSGGSTSSGSTRRLFGGGSDRSDEISEVVEEMESAGEEEQAEAIRSRFEGEETTEGVEEALADLSDEEDSDIETEDMTPEQIGLWNELDTADDELERMERLAVGFAAPEFARWVNQKEKKPVKMGTLGQFIGEQFKPRYGDIIRHFDLNLSDQEWRQTVYEDAATALVHDLDTNLDYDRQDFPAREKGGRVPGDDEEDTDLKPEEKEVLDKRDAPTEEGDPEEIGDDRAERATDFHAENAGGSPYRDAFDEEDKAGDYGSRDELR